MSNEVETLAALVQARHEEYVRRFDALDTASEGIAADVKSLLATRSFTHGMWRSVVIIATAVSTAIGLFIAWVKHS